MSMQLSHASFAAQVGDLRDFLGAHVAVEPVAAEQELVTHLELDPVGVDLHVVAIAHRAGDHVAVTAVFGLLRRDEALLELPRDERVIFREL